MSNIVRSQIAHGADLIKIYSDYRFGPHGEVEPAFTVTELQLAVSIANGSGREAVTHATSPEGMKRAIAAGFSTIEHGDEGTEDIFRTMKEKNIALCPTIAASEAVELYRGWHKGVDPDPERVVQKKKSFAAALRSGVTICMGGDVGVFAHGDNAREMELMVEYGMKPLDVLRSATSVNADVFGISKRVGRVRSGLLADILVVTGDPSSDIKNIRNVKLVMKNGIVYRE